MEKRIEHIFSNKSNELYLEDTTNPVNLFRKYKMGKVFMLLYRDRYTIRETAEKIGINEPVYSDSFYLTKAIWIKSNNVKREKEN